MRDRFLTIEGKGTVAVSDMTDAQIQEYLSRPTTCPPQGDLTWDAWYERLRIEVVARSLPEVR